MQPFSPTSKQLAATDRLIVVKGKLHVENASIYENRSWLSKIAKRDRYNSQKLLKALHDYAEKYKSKDKLPKLKNLEKNYRDALKQVSQENIKVTQIGCFKRICYQKQFVDLQPYKKDIAKLHSKAVHSQLTELKAKFDELDTKVSSLRKLKAPSSKNSADFILLAKEINSALKSLKKMEENSNKHSRKDIRNATEKFHKLSDNLNKALEKFDTLIIETCQTEASDESHYPDNINSLIKFLGDWEHIATHLSNTLNSLPNLSLKTLSSPIILQELARDCTYKNKEFVDKYDNATTEKIKVIIKDLSIAKDAVFDQDYVNDVNAKFKKAKKELTQLNKELKHNTPGKKEVEKTLKKVDDAYKNFKGNATSAILDLKLDIEKQFAQKLNTIEDLAKAEKLYNDSYNQLIPLVNPSDFNFFVEPLTPLLLQLQGEHKKVIKLLKAELHSKIKRFAEDARLEIDLEIERIKQLADTSQKLEQFKILSGEIAVKNVEELTQLYKECGIENYSTVEELANLCKHSKIARFISFELISKRGNQALLHVRQELSSILSDYLVDLEGDLKGKLKLNDYQSTLEKIKNAKQYLDLVVSSKKDLLKSYIKELKQFCLDEASKKSEELHDAIVKSKDELIADLEYELSVLDETSDVTNRWNKSLDKWLDDNEEAISFIVKFSKVQVTKRDYVNLISNRVNEILKDVNYAYEMAGHFKRNITPQLAKHRNAINDIKESVKKDPSQANLALQLAAINALKPDAELANFAKLKKLIVGFIEMQRQDLQNEFEELQKEQQAIIDDLKSKADSNPWKALFEDYADDETIFDVMDTECSIIQEKDAFVTYLNKLIKAHNDGKRGRLLTPLQLTDTAQHTPMDFYKILESVSLLSIEDYKIKEIYSDAALKEYLSKNLVSVHQNLIECGCFK